MTRGAHKALIVLVLWACTRPAVGQTAALQWSAPRTCPPASYVEKRIEALRKKPATPGRDLTVRARIKRVRRGLFALDLELRASDYAARRELESAKCQSLADAAAWLIAVALDPTLDAPSTDQAHNAPSSSETSRPLGSESEQDSAAVTSPTRASEAEQHAPTEPANPPRASAPQAPAQAEQVPAPASPTASTARTPAPHSISIRAGGARESPPRWWRSGVFVGLSSAALPGPQAALGARAGLGFGLLYAELRGAAAFANNRGLSGDTELRLATQEIGLALCPQWGHRVRAGPCATLAVNRTAGRVSRATETTDRALVWGNSGLSMQVGWRLTNWLEMMAEVGVSLPISARPRFTVEGLGEVATAAPASVYARVGLGIRSPDTARAK